MRPDWFRRPLGLRDPDAIMGRAMRGLREYVELRLAELENPDLMEICAALPIKRGCRR